MTDKSVDINEIEAAICHYFSIHPKASDTVRGIALIWLQHRYPLTAVQTALQNLALRGMLQARTLSAAKIGEDVLYSAAFAQTPNTEINN
jgi:hypothetical protein